MINIYPTLYKKIKGGNVVGRADALIRCRFRQERNKIPLQRQKINLSSGSELDSYEKINIFPVTGNP